MNVVSAANFANVNNNGNANNNNASNTNVGCRPFDHRTVGRTAHQVAERNRHPSARTFPKTDAR